MMDKIMTIPTTPAVGSPQASTPRATSATSQTSKEERSKGITEDPSATAFAAAMLAAGQQPVSQPAAPVPAKVQGETSVDGKATDKTPVPATEAKTLEVKSSVNTDSVVQFSPGLMQARAAAESAGTNAGTMIAGLQPQASTGNMPSNSTNRAMLEGSRSMKEWVFDGVEGNPNLRSLFSSQLGQVGQTGQGGAKVAENLLNKVQSEQQVRGEMVVGMEDAMPSVSADPMTSVQGNALSNDSGMSELSGKPGMLQHVAVERPQLNVVHANGSSTLSGAEFLSTLSSLKGGANLASQGESGAGSFGREGGKAGFKAGAGLGEVKKTRGAALGTDAGFDALTQGSASAAGVSGSAVLNGARTEVTVKPAENLVQAQVTTGSMSQDRIASASLAGISANIRNFVSQGQGGGEMRVKLNPENLGELHLRVVTDGKQVGLQIHASDDKARKILEESLGDLKDSLSKHQLSLGTVDFAVGQPQATLSSDMGSDSRQNPTHNPFGGMQDMMNNSGGDKSNPWAGAQEGASSREGWNNSSLRTAVPGGRSAAQMASASSNGAGGVASRRLDIRA